MPTAELLLTGIASPQKHPKRDVYQCPGFKRNKDKTAAKYLIAHRDTEHPHFFAFQERIVAVFGGPSTELIKNYFKLFRALLNLPEVSKPFRKKTV